MKRIISLCFILVLLMSFCACSGVSEETKNTATAMTKEEMMSQAETVIFSQINSDTLDNIAKAKMNYCDKFLITEGEVNEIKEDHIELRSDYASISVLMNVYLPLESIVELEVGQLIQIVGKTEPEIEVVKRMSGGYEIEDKYYNMKQAYLVKDRFVISGIYHGPNSDMKEFFSAQYPVFNFKVNDNPYLDLVFLREDVDLSKYSYGVSELTIDAKIIDEDHYFDAVIID